MRRRSITAISLQYHCFFSSHCDHDRLKLCVARWDPRRGAHRASNDSETLQRGTSRRSAIMSDLIASQGDGEGSVRKLWPTETEKFREHMLRLDKESRRMR